MFGGRASLFERLAGVYDNALIERRHIVAPTGWYLENRGWAERADLYAAAAEALFEQAALKALASARRASRPASLRASAFGPMRAACRSSGSVAPAG